MTIEFAQKNLLGQTTGKKSLFSGESIRVHSVNGWKYIGGETERIDVLSDDMVSNGVDLSKIKGLNGGGAAGMPYAVFIKQAINNANLRTKKDRFGRYSVVRWTETPTPKPQGK